MSDLRKLAIEFLDQVLGFLPAEELGPSSRAAIDQRFPSNDIAVIHAAFVKPGSPPIKVGCNPTSKQIMLARNVVGNIFEISSSRGNEALIFLQEIPTRITQLLQMGR